MLLLRAFGVFVLSALVCGHYGNPLPGGGGCSADEEVQVEFSGEMCCPRCAFEKCPRDVPAKVTAKPACVLGSSRTSVPLFCALECKTDAECGAALCQNVSGAGDVPARVCVYPN